MNSKTIGNIGEAKVLAKFVELGIPVYIPFGDNEKADLVADFNGKLNKIQVKTSVKAENGIMKFKVTSSTLHHKNGCKHIYTPEEIDYFACYNIARDKIFLIKVEKPFGSTISIRYEAPLNNRVSDIRFESDYLIENILSSNISFEEEEQSDKEQKFCSECGKLLSARNTSGLCNKCSLKKIRKVDRPSKETLEKELRETNFVQVGKKYGVTDNAIRKWCASYGMSTKAKDYK